MLALRWIAGATAALGVAAILGVLALVTVLPQSQGMVTRTILTPSMVPVFHPGDVVVIDPAAKDEVAMGDIITFMPEPGNPDKTYTHTLVGKSFQNGKAMLTTQGVANNAPDAPIRPEQVAGKVVRSYPKIGYLLDDKRYLLAAIGVCTALGLFSLTGPGRSRTSTQPSAHTQYGTSPRPTPTRGPARTESLVWLD